jgi:hypothetical protein
MVTSKPVDVSWKAGRVQLVFCAFMVIVSPFVGARYRRMRHANSDRHRSLWNLVASSQTLLGWSHRGIFTFSEILVSSRRLKGAARTASDYRNPALEE